MDKLDSARPMPKKLLGNPVVLIIVLRPSSEQYALQSFEPRVLVEEPAALLSQLVDLGAVTLRQEATSKQPVQMLRDKGVVQVGPVHDPRLPHRLIPYHGEDTGTDFNRTTVMDQLTIIQGSLNSKQSLSFQRAMTPTL